MFLLYIKLYSTVNVSIPNADIWLSAFCRTRCLKFFSFGQSGFWIKTCRDLGRNKHFDFVIFNISIFIRTSQISLFFNLHIIHTNRQNLTSHTFYSDNQESTHCSVQGRVVWFGQKLILSFPVRIIEFPKSNFWCNHLRFRWIELEC